MTYNIIFPISSNYPTVCTLLTKLPNCFPALFYIIWKYVTYFSSIGIGTLCVSLCAMALYSCRRLLRKVPSDIGKPSKIHYLKQLRKNCFEWSELHLGKIQQHSPGSVFLWILVRLNLLYIMFYGESYFAFFIWVI